MTDARRSEELELASLPLDALCDRLLTAYHAPVHALVPTIRARLAAVAERTPRELTDHVRQAFAAAADTLLAHLAKEANILFPALAALAEAERAGRPRPPLPFPTVLHPIRALEAEHARLAAAFEELLSLAEAHPDPDSRAWAAVRADLAALRDSVTAQMRIEADVLFPRAADLDLRL